MKRLSYSLIAVVTLLLMWFVGIPAGQYAIRYGEIKALSVGADQLLRQSRIATDLVRFSLGGSVDGYATRLVMNKALRGANLPAGEVTTYYVWWGLNKIFLSEEERLGVLLQHAPTGGALDGLSAASQEMFGKSLDELSENQLAVICVVMRAPSYRKDPVKLSEASEALLKNYHAK